MASREELPNAVGYLIQQISKGQAFLLLGAGASITSRNQSRQNLKTGPQLAQFIAKQSGFEFQGEPLADVVQACIGRRLSDAQFHQILNYEYTKCSASQELRALFSYPWVRAYTLNIDDAVERIGSLQSRQRLNVFNGRIDKVLPKDETGLPDLHLVHLNGEARRPEHGLIFSKDDYSRALTTNQPWYTELATDYQKYTPVIVGSALNEPILDVELERIKKRDGRSGTAFLITPTNFTAIQKSIFEEKNICHLKLTLEDFCDFLRRELGPTLSVEAVAAHARPNFDPDIVENLTHDDLKTAMSVRPVAMQSVKEALARTSESELARRAKNFLQGGPPSWQLIASDAPINLHEGKGFLPFLKKSVTDGFKMIVVTGVAGSGKSTLAMQALAHVLEGEPTSVLYELGAEAPSYARVFSLLQRLHPNQRVYLFVNDLFLYGDQLHFDLTTIRGNDIVVVTTARSGEWKERFDKYFKAEAAKFDLQRFSAEDYEPLTQKILQYVPAPNFSKASPEERLRRFHSSKRQLLIALREITESKNFDDVIDDEYQKLPDEATKYLFRIVGVATLARVGVDEALVTQIYGAKNFSRSYMEARNALEGVVLRNAEGRLQVRHELYVEHIFRKAEPLTAFIEAITALLATLSRYKIPLLSSLSRADAQLFKFLLNHRTLLRRCRAGGEPALGLSVYEQFEKAFELDGHFWLQFALYCRSLDRLTEALSYLSKSIEAYPENPAAIHALGDMKLRLAADPSVSETLAHRYIDEAVAELMRLDARQDDRSDYYPMVTLADRHVHALLVRNQASTAREVARKYFPRIQELERSINAPVLTQLKTNVLKFVSTGVWVQTEYIRHKDD